MYERFTDSARKVMQLARKEAHRFNHEYIGTEHILLGLIEADGSVSVAAMSHFGIDLRKVRSETEKLMTPCSDTVVMGELPKTPRAQRSIEYSMEESRNLNHHYVGTEHILLGLLHEQDGVAAKVLMNLGLKLEEVREEVVKMLAEEPLVNDPTKSQGM